MQTSADDSHHAASQDDKKLRSTARGESVAAALFMANLILSQEKTG